MMNVEPVVPASNTLPIHQYIAISISLPSMILYIVTVVLIVRARIRDRLFDSPFFSLILVQFANDFLFYIFFQLCLRGTRWYVIPWNGPVIGTFALYGWITWRNILFLGHIPFALNRISLYLWPGSYGNIWSKKAVLMCLLVQWAVPVAISGGYFAAGCRGDLVDQPEIRALLSSCGTMSTYQSWFFVALSTGICLICYGVCYSLSSRQKKLSDLEQKLLLCSILQAIPMFAEFVRTLISFLLLYVFKTDQYDADSWVVKFWSEVLYYYIDTSVTIQPYCLLITNTHVRKLFLCRKRNNVIKGSSVLWAI